MKELILRERLKERINTLGILKQGNFVLSSGARSGQYFDCKTLIGDPKSLEYISLLLLDRIKQESVVAVGGIVLGGALLSTALSAFASLYWVDITTFMIRTTNKFYGLQKVIEGTIPLGANKKVALIDDVITTGKTIMKAVQIVEERGYEISLILTVYDRNEGGSKKLKDMGYTFYSILQNESDLKPFYHD